jgi:predicted transcriptional regulator
MASWNELTWVEAMQRAFEAVSLSEQLYDEIDELQGRSNVDIEKHLRRAEVKAAHAQAWIAIAQALATRGDRYGGT